MDHRLQLRALNMEKIIFEDSLDCFDDRRKGNILTPPYVLSLTDNITEEQWRLRSLDLSYTVKGRFRAMWTILRQPMLPCCYGKFEDYQPIVDSWKAALEAVSDLLDSEKDLIAKGPDDNRIDEDGNTSALQCCECGCSVVQTKKWSWDDDGTDYSLGFFGTEWAARSVENLWNAWRHKETSAGVCLKPQQVASLLAIFE